MKTKITALLNTYQPNTNAFGGLGVTPNALCWVGTESGNPGGEIWSTGGQNKGDPNSNVWCPKGCDTTLQNGDVWFFEKASKIRSLAELIGVYHATVGRNGMLELDFAINRDGLVEPIHAARYKELGDFVNTCYVTGLKYVTSGSCTAQGCVLEIDLAKGVSPADASVTTAATGVTIDRTMIQEQLADGQRVRSYKVELITSAGATVQLSAGHSVGNKRIDVASKPVENVVKARLTVLQYVGPAVDITRFAVFAPCQSA
jgi:alpha-L-fucosidase